MGEEHINSNDFDLSVKGFEKCVDVLNEMKNNNFQVIYPSAGQALSRDYQRRQTISDSCLLSTVDSTRNNRSLSTKLAQRKGK